MSQVEIETAKQKLKIPNRFEVLLLNDDYTSMEFVVEVLKRFFHKEFFAAEAIMLKIHIDGEAVCGTYSFDVAQTKVSQVPLSKVAAGLKLNAVSSVHPETTISQEPSGTIAFGL